MSDVIDLTDAMEKVSQVFSILEKAGKDTRPAMVSIASFMRSRAGLSFRMGQDPYGKAWAALKVRQGQPLVDKGILRSSVRTAVTDDTAEIGTNDERARTHQFGAKMPVTVGAHVKRITQAFGKKLKFPVYASVKTHVKKMNVPARPFLPTQSQGLPPAWESGILNIMIKQLNKAGIA